MNREILFRGKRKNNGEWVEGCFVKYQPCASEDKIIYGIVPEYASSLYLIEIDLSTRGRYTGLKDKNGVRIFEGDIVKAFKHNEKPFTFVITFRVGCFWFGNWNWIEFLDTFRNVEVIGNVYDNPELLEGEDEK